MSAGQNFGMTIGAVEPSARELSSLSEACGKLWDLDDNRLEPGRDYHLNLQVRKICLRFTERT
jgi:hypothetical protein